MNKVILMGRLTRDPDIRYANSGTTIANFTLAVDRRFKREGEQTADFPTCIAFGKTAEFVEKYFTQGVKAVVSGRLQTGSYTNREGNKVYTTDIIVEDIEFVESKKASYENSASGGRQKEADNGDDDFMSIPDGLEEELPFV